MKIRSPLIGALALVGIVCFVYAYTESRKPVPNPDPNHTHADFAVILNNERVDFSGEKFMSGSSENLADPARSKLNQYLHLHDGNGDVMHRHKPELTLGEFFGTLPGVTYTGTMFSYNDCYPCKKLAIPVKVSLYVNGLENPNGSAYIFEDGDKVLLTSSTDPVDVRQQNEILSDEACMYSRTCPWKGDPPTENCIADPEIPCIVPTK